MMFLTVMLSLDFLVYEQLDVFVSRQVHRDRLHPQACSEWCPRLFSPRNHCTYTSERQMNTYDTWRHGNTHSKQSFSGKPKWTWELTCNILGWMIMKVAQFQLRGQETDCQDCSRHSLGCWETGWLLELRDAQSNLADDYRDCTMPKSSWEGLPAYGQICAISWAKQPLSSRNVQNSPRCQCQEIMHKYKEEGEPSFPRLRNSALVKAEPGPRLAQFADGWLKESKWVNALQH